MAHPYWPLFDLRLRTPRLELRPATDDDLTTLAAVAAAGVHDPDFMPFSVTWTDQPSPQLERGLFQFFWRQRAMWTADDWHLPLVVVAEGVVVGVQGIGAHRFRERRVCGTGSWLGQVHQGKGIGKEMRAAVVHLAFAGLDAVRCESGAWEDNHASLGVSRSLGYRENGDTIELRRGRAERQVKVVLTREEWEARPRIEVDVQGLEPCLPMFGAGEEAGDEVSAAG